MKLLLAGDPAAKKAIEKIGAGFEFQDVDSTNAEQMAAVAELVKAIKTLLADLSRRGSDVVRERLSVALGRNVSAAEVATLMVGMSPDTSRGAAGWLGFDKTTNESPTLNDATTTLARLTARSGRRGRDSR